MFNQLYIDVVFIWCLAVGHFPNCRFHFFSCYFLFKSLCSSDELLDVVDVFFVKVLHDMLFYYLWTSCGCDTHRSWSSFRNWIFWYFMWRAFSALNVQVSSLAFYTSPARSSALFLWHLQLSDSSLRVSVSLIFSIACSFLGICNFQSGVLYPSVLLTSFQGLDLTSGGYLLSFCIWYEFLRRIWLCPWAFPICSLAVLLLMRYSRFLV